MPVELEAPGVSNGRPLLPYPLGVAEGVSSTKLRQEGTKEAAGVSCCYPLISMVIAVARGS
jgi:hypothetical protein